MKQKIKITFSYIYGYYSKGKYGITPYFDTLLVTSFVIFVYLCLICSILYYFFNVDILYVKYVNKSSSFFLKLGFSVLIFFCFPCSYLLKILFPENELKELQPPKNKIISKYLGFILWVLTFLPVLLCVYFYNSKK